MTRSIALVCCVVALASGCGFADAAGVFTSPLAAGCSLGDCTCQGFACQCDSLAATCRCRDANCSVFNRDDASCDGDGCSCRKDACRGALPTSVVSAGAQAADLACTGNGCACDSNQCTCEGDGSCTCSNAADTVQCTPPGEVD